MGEIGRQCGEEKLGEKGKLLCSCRILKSITHEEPVRNDLIIFKYKLYNQKHFLHEEED